MVKKPELIEKVRQSGKILAEVLRILAKSAVVGARLDHLDKLAHELILKAGGQPVFLGYHPYGAKVPYPATICTSVNDVIVHGTPGNYRLKNGDLLKIDAGVDWRGGISDSAITVPIGKVSDRNQRLLEIAKSALYEGIKAAKAGNTLGDIGYAIESTVKKAGFFVVDGLTGHGVGEELHEDPVVYNTGKRGGGIRLKEGMILALEPMISTDTRKIVQLKDDSYATADGSMSAHFEHTVLIKKGSAEILTQ